MKKTRPEDYLAFVEDELHTERNSLFDSLSMPMGKVNKILLEKVKKRHVVTIKKYISHLSSKKEELDNRLQPYFIDKTILPKREEEPPTEIEKYAYFLSDYIRLILIEYIVKCCAHFDFHTHADDQMIGKIKQAENYITAQENKAKDAYRYLKDAKKYSDAYFKQEHIKHYPKFNEKQYIEGEQVDFINFIPFSKITDEDIENAYQTLMKMVHWTVYANSARELIQNKDGFSKKTSGGQDSTIEGIFVQFIGRMYTPLYIANIPTEHSAQIIKVGFDHVTKPFTDTYDQQKNKNAFTYEASTIEGKLKTLKAQFKSVEIEELILKI